MDMKISTFKPLALGLIVGLIASPAIGLSMSWLVTGKTANQMAADAATNAYIEGFTPRCVETAKSQPEKLAEFGTKRWDSDKRKFVEGAGWLVYPDKATRGLKNALQGACTKELAKL